MFGLKDVFTTINLLGGCASLFLCVEGEPFWAGIAIIVGYFLGDAIDGWVARKTGTSNEFGAEYDTISDHLSHAIAPAAIVYVIYRDADLLGGGHADMALGVALACCIIVASTIRHARNAARDISVAGIWVGLPRTVLGFLAFSFVNSRVLQFIPGGLWGGVLMIPLFSMAALTYWPFPMHRRANPLFVKICFGGFFVTTAGMLVLAPSFTFDVFFFWTFIYTFGSWTIVSSADRQKLRDAIASQIGSAA